MKVLLKCLFFVVAGVTIVLPSYAQSNSPTQKSSSRAAVSSSQEPTQTASTDAVPSSNTADGAPGPAVPDPQPLPNPAMTGPLQTALPREVRAGPFGTVAVTGVLSGIGMTQARWAPGDKERNWDLSNGQIFLQKTTGWWQFYLQGGAYNLPALGAPFVATPDTAKRYYGPFPEGYLKLVKGNFSVMVGALPTLIGAEYTFSFENMNIERGLLWNQENAVNRGLQLNETFKKLSASLSWNDGFYSNRYTWLTGSLTYAFNSASSLAFVGGGNLSQTAYATAATPAQSNSQIYNVIFTYSQEAWVVQPYFQYTNVPTNPKIGITRGAATRGGAFLLTYNFKHGISMAVRPEYISSTGSVSNGAVNLLYGPGSSAFGFTVTPTYRKEGFFLRGEFSIVNARYFTAGDAFGSAGLSGTQPRGLAEAGFLF